MSDNAPPSRPPTPAEFLVKPFQEFTKLEASGGILLLAFAVAALVWANSPFGQSYVDLWHVEVVVGGGALRLEKDLLHWINDGLMAVFFLLVGLELKRELLDGELASPRKAALPIFAAVGGMLVPAAFYLALNLGGPGEAGWGIPMATDIAFALAVLAALGSRAPTGLKVFLTALAIVDDLGAIAVIAIFYTSELYMGYLGAAILGLVVVWAAGRIGIRSLAFYVPIALATWYFLLESGVHATLAGVALGFLTPARSMYTDAEYRDRAGRILSRYEFEASAPRAAERVDHDALAVASIARESVSPLNRIEDALHPWSSFLIVPLFALANAGVRFAGVDLVEAATHPVALGVTFGLLVGKTAGISAFAWLAVRLKLGVLPRLVTWRHIVGLAAVAGIGFTVSLFVTGLAFEHPELADRAKTGIFIGSGAAGLLGYLVLRSTTPHDSSAS